MLRHIKPGMLVFSVLYILLGLLLLLAPRAVADVFCIALGLLVVLCGLQSLYGYFKKDNGSIRAAVSLLLSLLLIDVIFAICHFLSSSLLKRCVPAGRPRRTEYQKSGCPTGSARP